ncbi:MAG: N-formylglutamate deformylase [Alphaproteobacteria bacterium]|nr:MAG: N-formylglutamate deformylase [Alphaproteobacteria bacterium]
MSAAPLYKLTQGSSPILISVPHCGTHIPDDLRGGMSDAAKLLTDTDWHVDRLYGCLADLNVTMLTATHSRYVIDLNRPPDGKPLYPGQTETTLCPLETFAGQPIYLDGQTPDGEETQRRLEHYWLPYHAALASQLERLQGLHERVLLWDAHSIANQVPRLFDGQLPDLNFGTNGGLACQADLLKVVNDRAAAQYRYSHVTNARFKGGYITRYYGRPDAGVEAIQLELSQATYMDQSPPFAYDENKALHFQDFLRNLIETLQQRLR